MRLPRQLFLCCCLAQTELLFRREVQPPAQKTFDAEGEVLEHALTKSFRNRNEAIKRLCSSVRRFRDATVIPECESDYPHALRAFWKALYRAEDLIQN